MSDFKHIVKESLREAFYTPKVVVKEGLIEADKPTKLGCWWMRPNLTFFTTAPGYGNDNGIDHEPAARIELGKKDPKYLAEDLYKELTEKGYVRIVSEVNNTIYFNTPAKESQVRRLRDICIEENRSLISDDGENERTIYQRKADIKEADVYTGTDNDSNLEQPLIEADKPNRLGCWWMRPDLTFFTALRKGATDHEVAALIELGRPHPSYPYEELFKRGYLRMLVNNTTIFFSSSKQITPAQVRRLYDICVEDDKDLTFDTGGKHDKVVYKSRGNLHESLFLLEESCREIDLWNENKA